MTVTKLRIHNITSKTALGYGKEVWTTKRRGVQKLGAAQMRFLRPSSGLTRLDCQRNCDILNGLKPSSLLEDKIISEKLERSSEANGHNYRNQLSSPSQAEDGM
jgi:hypothetical protein